MWVHRKKHMFVCLFILVRYRMNFLELYYLESTESTISSLRVSLKCIVVLEEHKETEHLNWFIVKHFVEGDIDLILRKNILIYLWQNVGGDTGSNRQ